MSLHRLLDKLNKLKQVLSLPDLAVGQAFLAINRPILPQLPGQEPQREQTEGP